MNALCDDVWSEIISFLPLKDHLLMLRLSTDWRPTDPTHPSFVPGMAEITTSTYKLRLQPDADAMCCASIKDHAAASVADGSNDEWESAVARIDDAVIIRTLDILRASGRILDPFGVDTDRDKRWNTALWLLNTLCACKRDDCDTLQTHLQQRLRWPYERRVQGTAQVPFGTLHDPTKARGVPEALLGAAALLQGAQPMLIGSHTFTRAVVFRDQRDGSWWLAFAGLDCRFPEAFAEA